MNIYLNLFLTFLKLGATTFGGGYAMIANIREIVVDKKGWLNNDELLEICAIAESTPGPIAINLATFIGYKNGKFLGSLCATLGVIIPSTIIILIISLFLNQFLENKYVAYAFTGIKCAVAFLIIKAGFTMFKKMKKSVWQITILLVVLALMIVFELLAISFSSIYLIIIGGFLGLLILWILENKKEVEQL